jgi:hypothetical protein
MASENITTIHVGGLDALSLLTEIAGSADRKAVLEAAAALKAEEREERSISGDHMATLFEAVARRRGPFILRLERELSAYYAVAGTR